MQFYSEFLYFHKRNFIAEYFTFIIYTYIFAIIIKIKTIFL